jgi:hypothetical protein
VITDILVVDDAKYRRAAYTSSMRHRQSSGIEAWIKLVIGAQPGNMYEQHEYCSISGKLEEREAGGHAKTKRPCNKPSEGQQNCSIDNPVQQYYSPPMAPLPFSKHLRLQIRFQMQKESVQPGPSGSAHNYAGPPFQLCHWRLFTIRMQILNCRNILQLAIADRRPGLTA